MRLVSLGAVVILDGWLLGSKLIMLARSLLVLVGLHFVFYSL